MAANTTPYPPSHPRSSTSLTPSAALENLSTYLTASQTHAHLHPDSVLDPAAIKFSATGGPSGGLVLHHLRRVQQGLQGEVLAPEKGELEALFGGASAAAAGDDTALDGLVSETARGLNANGGAKRKGVLKKTSSAAAADFETGALDPVEYARNQEVLVGEVGDRDPADGYAAYDDAMDVDGYADDGAGASMGAKDKEARKEEKKRRRQMEKREKETKKATKD